MALRSLSFTECEQSLQICHLAELVGNLVFNLKVASSKPKLSPAELVGCLICIMYLVIVSLILRNDKIIFVGSQGERHYVPYYIQNTNKVSKYVI